MTNEKILKKAIEKVYHKIQYLLEDVIEDLENGGYYSIIFSHDFAKAFWGEELKGWPPMDWENHLQQMVLEKEPLKYLEKWL